MNIERCQTIRPAPPCAVDYVCKRPRSAPAACSPIDSTKANIWASLIELLHTSDGTKKSREALELTTLLAAHPALLDPGIGCDAVASALTEAEPREWCLKP